MRLIAKIQKEFDEKEDSCTELKTTILELEDTSISMKESYEYMIRVSLNVTSYAHCTTTEL